MSKAKVNKQIHVPNSKMGHGDHYGSAIRNKTARSVDITGGIKNKIKMKNPPKALA